jgi:hypothetical protein
MRLFFPVSVRKHLALKMAFVQNLDGENSLGLFFYCYAYKSSNIFFYKFICKLNEFDGKIIH